MVGHTADPREPSLITTNKGYIVNGTDVKDPDDLAEEILKKVNVGKERRFFTSAITSAMLVEVNRRFEFDIVCRNIKFRKHLSSRTLVYSLALLL